MKVVEFNGFWEVLDGQGLPMEFFASKEEAEAALAEFEEAGRVSESMLINAPVQLDGTDWSDQCEE